MAEVRIDGQAHISKIPNTHCRTRMKKKIHTKKEEERSQVKSDFKQRVVRRDGWPLVWIQDSSELHLAKDKI